MVIDLKAPQVFEPLFKGELAHYREIVYSGGRGSGKTTNAVAFLAMKFLTEKRCNILCLREYAKSTSNSVKAEFDSFFQENGFDSLFVENGEIHHKVKKGKKETILKIKTTTIINNLNNNKIIFAGITRHTVRALKSLKGIKYCFIDESDFLGEEEYRILKPTIRAEGAQIICCFNPKSEDDYIYQLFLNPTDRRYCKKVNYTENPFFPKVLDDDRKDDLKTMPEAIYKHVWEGYPLENIEGIIFSKETIALMQDTQLLKIGVNCERSSFDRLIIACDPATTNKDKSNEYGIILLGLKGGVCYIVEDLSKNATPNEFAQIVDSAYKQYDCDFVCVETNQGGDFIKSTLITQNPFMVVQEVRAVSDKVNRALPVANMASLGKIKLANTNRDKLVRQMKRLTNMGYLGAKGESPDRLDAMVWGVYTLFNLAQAGTQGKIFKTSYLQADTKGILNQSSTLFVYFDDVSFGALLYDLVYSAESGYQAKIKESYKGDIVEVSKVLGSVDYEILITNNAEFNHLLENKSQIITYDRIALDLQDKVAKTLALLQNSVNVLECEISYFDGVAKNWILQDLLSYETEAKVTHSPLVHCFCDLILQIKG